MIERMDRVGIVVDDLAAATEFFVELGLELEGEASVQGRWVDRIVGLVDDIDAVVAGLRARGAELVGEVAQYEDQLPALLRPRPGRHHRGAGRADRLTVGRGRPWEG
jgi:catechol 2,3-dioxygenase-like lactoylglutathione lyase family enzyme